MAALLYRALESLFPLQQGVQRYIVDRVLTAANRYALYGSFYQSIGEGSDCAMPDGARQLNRWFFLFI